MNRSFFLFALRPVVCVPTLVTHFPGPAPGACFVGQHSPWSPPLAPQNRGSAGEVTPPCSSASVATMAESGTSASVHHRGFGSASPSRCGPGRSVAFGPNAGSPSFRCIPLVRVTCSPTPAGRQCCSHSGIAHVAFDYFYGLRSCDMPISVAPSHTPRTCCVRFVVGALPSAHATLATGRPATALPGPVFPPVGLHQLRLAPSRNPG